MAQKMQVTYTDGTTATVTATPRAQINTERYLREQGGLASVATAVEAMGRLAYEASRPGIGNVGFEEWLDKVADLEAICSKCGEVGIDIEEHECSGADASGDPTHAAPSTTPSSD